jgi:inosine-uridine nucleoside N-ribohydrolase
MDDNTKWIIDTDPGCDDMIAIMYLMKRLKGKIELVSLTEGNAKMHHIEINIKRIMTIIGCNPLIMRGASHSIQYGTGYSYEFHKSDGLGDIEDFKNIDYSRVNITEGSSILKIVEICKKYPKQVKIFSIGPLTNLALAYMVCPSIVDDISEIYIMGGSTTSRGNSSGLAEANFGFDYISNRIVFENYKKIYLTGWESTENMKFRVSHLRELKQKKMMQNFKIDENIFDAIYKILDVYDSINGLEICDFFAATSIFRKEVIKSWSLSSIDCAFDSFNSYGLSVVKYLNNHNKLDILKAADVSSRKEKCVIVIDEFQREILEEELCSIFTIE